MRALLTQVSQETWPFPQRVLDMLKGLRGRRDLQVSIWRPSEVGTELVRPQAQSHVGPGSQPLPPHATFISLKIIEGLERPKDRVPGL